MNPEDCTLYEKCECPLCPLIHEHQEPSENKKILKYQIWHPEDEICKNQQFETITRSMKKLKRKAAAGYFTLGMLSRDFVVRRGTEGIDADLPDSAVDPWKEYQRREKTWLKRHPEIPRERKEKMRELGLKSIVSIQKPPSHPSISETVDSKGMTASPDPLSSEKSGQNEGASYD